VKWGKNVVMEEGTNQSRVNRYRTLKGYCRGGGVCIDVDGVEDNGTARDELVDAEIEGTARFGGLGEFFVP